MKSPKRYWSAAKVVEKFCSGVEPVSIAIAAYSPSGRRDGGLAWCAGEEGQACLYAVNETIRRALRKSIRHNTLSICVWCGQTQPRYPNDPAKTVNAMIRHAMVCGKRPENRLADIIDRARAAVEAQDYTTAATVLRENCEAQR